MNSAVADFMFHVSSRPWTVMHMKLSILRELQASVVMAKNEQAANWPWMISCISLFMALILDPTYCRLGKSASSNPNSLKRGLEKVDLLTLPTAYNNVKTSVLQRDSIYCFGVTIDPFTISVSGSKAVGCIFLMWRERPPVEELNTLYSFPHRLQVARWTFLSSGCAQRLQGRHGSSHLHQLKIL